MRVATMSLTVTVGPVAHATGRARRRPPQRRDRTTQTQQVVELRDRLPRSDELKPNGTPQVVRHPREVWFPKPLRAARRQSGDSNSDV